MLYRVEFVYRHDTRIWFRKTAEGLQRVDNRTAQRLGLTEYTVPFTTPIEKYVDTVEALELGIKTTQS